MAKSRDEIRSTLGLLHDPGDVVELRVLHTRQGTVFGYFDDFDALAREATALDGGSEGVYATLNPVRHDLLARAVNRTKPYAKVTTGDRDIVRRRWLLVDFDSVRPPGISATDAEHRGALARAAECRPWLIEHGVPAGAIVSADSGNGGHLLVRADLPNDDPARALVERVLKAVAFHFTDETVSVDVTTGNAARITKVYGTLAMKGDSTPDRPHRRSRLVEWPERPVACPTDVMERLAALAPEPPAFSGRGTATGAVDVEAWLSAHGLGVWRQGPWNGGRRWILSVCPWNPEHTNHSAYVLQFATGAVAAGCHHNGCAGKDWHALRDAVEPGWRNGKAADRSRGDQAKSGQNKGGWTLGDPEPWPDAVNAAALLADIEAFFSRYAVLPDGTALVLALWAASTWVMSAFEAHPFVAVTSPEKRCGKSRVLELLQLACCRALPVANISDAALYRTVEREAPALLIDEAQHLRTRDERSGAIHDMLCASTRRPSAFVYRMGGANRDELQRFSVFCPKAIALIGGLTEFLADRAIPIRMQRRKPSDRLGRFLFDRVKAETEPLRRRLARWAQDSLDAIQGTYRGEDPPSWLADREAELWAPLFAVARITVSARIAEVESVAKRLSASKTEADDSLGVRLLADIRTIMDSQHFVPTKDLVAALVAIEDGPWPEYRAGRAITAKGLADLLRPFGVEPGKARHDGHAGVRGYFRQAFQDAWERYPVLLPSSEAPQTPQPLKDKAQRGIPDAPQTPPVAGVEMPANASRTRVVADVADQTPLGRQGPEKETSGQVPPAIRDDDGRCVFLRDLAASWAWPSIYIGCGERVAAGEAAWARFLARAPMDRIGWAIDDLVSLETGRP